MIALPLRRFIPRFSLRTLIVFLLLVTSALGLRHTWPMWYCEHVFRGHTDRVMLVKLSRSGAKLLSSSRDGTARVWDAVTGRGLSVIDCRERWLIGFSRDETRAFTATGSAVQVWDAGTGELLSELRGLRHGPRRITLSPDGRRVLTEGHMTSPARYWPARTERLLWDLETGKLVARLPAVPWNESPYTFTSGGKYVISPPSSSRPAVFDAATGTWLGNTTTPPAGPKMLVRDPANNVVAEIDASEVAWMYTPAEDDEEERFLDEFGSDRYWEAVAARPFVSLGTEFGPEGPRSVSRDGNVVRVWRPRSRFTPHGLVSFPGFWLPLLFGLLLISSILRDRKALHKQAGLAIAPVKP